MTSIPSFISAALGVAVGLPSALVAGQEDAPLPPDVAAQAPLDFRQHIEPIFLEYCFDCHGDGETEGELSLDYADSESLEAFVNDRHKWGAVWENLRTHTMPPSRKPQPTDDERELVAAWIQGQVFGIDCDNPDPGRVTIRRLNRNEYRHTIKDLFDVDYDTDENFPADDSGFGFDNIGDALSLSPLLMEKYVSAAEDIVSRIVHTEGPLIPHRQAWSNSFRRADDDKEDAENIRFKDAKSFSRNQHFEHEGEYEFTVKGRVEGSREASSHTSTLVFRVRGKEVARRQFGWDNSRELTFSGKAELPAGEHEITIENIPGEPPGDDENELTFRFSNVNFHGPLDGSYREYPDGYQKIFRDGPPPDGQENRAPYARKLLTHYAERIYRRPVDEATVDRLVALVRMVDEQEGKRFEHGFAQALTALLASPRFLFRAETQPDPDDPNSIAQIDEHALASRLSYFLWNSLPDDTLFDLAREGRLRAELRPQVDRMLEDSKFDRFVESFVGQWLQARDILALPIDARRVLGRERRDEADRIFNHRVRRAMRDELQLLFRSVAVENRSVLDFLDADYTFLNEDLAEFYDIPGVKVDGREMRRVSLPEESVRGGVLSSGGLLVVTSNPTRTSPVKRGLFVLENILGAPAPPAPPDVPDLGESTRKLDRGEITMRKVMEIHREQPICASCHARMDPIGLAMENFNALGMWRDEEERGGAKIDASGELLTGEEFSDVRQLKKILVGQRRGEFYRCLAEKLFTYALGRGPEYYDSCTLDTIADRLEASGGKFEDLLMGVIESPAFQKRRGDGDESKTASNSTH